MSKPQTSETVEQLAWKLAGAKRDCEGVHTEGLSWPDLTDYTSRKVETRCSAGCNGTGQVYVLPDSVRVPCRRCSTEPPLIDCVWGCHGLGYTPSMSLEVWLKAVKSVGLIWQASATLGWSVYLPGHCGDDDIPIFEGKPLSAFLRALAAALERRG